MDFNTKSDLQSTERLVPAIVPIIITQPRELLSPIIYQTDVAIAYRNLLQIKNKDLYDLLNASKDFNTQLSENINSTDDFIENITCYINKTIIKDDDVLIVDYENVAFSTYGRNIKSKNGIKLNINPIDKNKLLPNINSDEIIYYRIATYFILNYACKNNFKHVFVVCKNTASEDFFKKDYTQIITNGQIILDADSTNTTFNCSEIQTCLRTIKCTCFKINNRPSLMCAKASQICDSHALKGSDDSIAVILYVILTQFVAKPKIMSRDGKMFNDFKTDQKYIIPFKLSIIDLQNQDSINEFVVNYFSHQFIIPDYIDDDSIRHDRINFTNLIPQYYYGQSILKLDGTYDVKNWYQRDGNKKNVVINSLVPQTTFQTSSYVQPKSNMTPTLNESKKPYLDLSGRIVRLDSHPDIPYVTWDNRNREYIPSFNYNKPYTKHDGSIQTVKIDSNTIIPYCKKVNGKWEPILNRNTPYRNNGYIASIIIGYEQTGKPIYKPYCYNKDGVWYATLKESLYLKLNGDIDTITKYDWQPYLKKYNVTKSNKYYNKYLKYKAKYNALKKKLNI